MHQTERKSKLSIHVVCILCAWFLCFVVEVITRVSMPNSIPSMYSADMHMPQNSFSALEISTIKALNSHITRLHVYMDHSDPQIFLKFNNRQTFNIHSIEIQLEKSFAFDLDCVLYYPQENGHYVEECKRIYALPKGETSIFFDIPEEVTYQMKELRFDIDEDYVIHDIILSEDELDNDYYPEEDFRIVPMIILFIFLLFVFELLIFFYQDIMNFLAEAWKMKKKIAVFLLILIAGCAAGFAAGFVMSRRSGNGIWFWGVILSLYAVIMLYQIFLLWKKDPKLVPIIQNKDTRRTRRFFWLAIAVFCIMVVFEWVDGTMSAPELAFKIRFSLPFAFAAIESVLLALLFKKYVLDVQENSISFLKIYPYVLFLLALAYMIVFLPYVSPDETSHYLSAYRVSDLILGKIGQMGEKRLLMRVEDYNFFDKRNLILNADNLMQTTENFHLFVEKTGYIIIEAPMVSNAIFSYCTSGIGIAIARILHLSGVMTFYAGRFTNMLFFILVIRYMMKKIPFGRTALFTIAAMPMTLHMAASYSYDVSTFCFVALFVTQVMCMICSPEKITRRDYSLCILYGILMAPSKLVYLPLIFLVLLVPNESLAEDRKKAIMKKLLVIGIGIASAVLIMLAVNLLGTDPAIRKMMEGNATVSIISWNHEPGYTFSWVLGHPFAYIMMNIRTIVNMLDYYFFTMVGSSLGWLDINVPKVYTVVSFILFLLAVNIRDDASAHIQISLKKKIWIVILCLSCVFLTMQSMLLNWTPLSYNYILGVQGRYFLPLLIPVIWVVRNDIVRIRSIIRKHIVLLTVMINIWLLVYIFAQCNFGVTVA